MFFFRYFDFVQVRVDYFARRFKSFPVFYRLFFLAESMFVHDLNFDFFLFEHLPPLLIVDFCIRTLDLTVASFVMYSN